MQHYKAIEERAMLDLFAGLFGDFPKGRIVQLESPDFVIRKGNKRSVGIELTKLYLSASLKDQNHKPKLKLLPAHLQQAIARKNDKMPLYNKRRLDALWLVVVTGFDESAGRFKPGKDLFSHAYECRFNRVFLLDILKKQLDELMIA